MAEAGRLLRATLYKWRHGWFWPLHLGAVFLAIGLSLAYTLVFKSDAVQAWAVFIELIAMAFPLVIAALTSLVAEQELAAGGGQWMLMQPRRVLALFVPLGVLLASGWLATAGSVLGYNALLAALREVQLPFGVCLRMATLLWLGVVIVYGVHFFLALRFERTLNLSIGAIGMLLAALMQTGMGEGLWPFIPYGWGGRFIMAAFAQALGASVANFRELQLGLFFCVVGICGMIGILSVWFTRWGGQRSD